MAGKYPSPSRPARRAAASEWPPTVIGTAPPGGLGNDTQSVKSTNSPAKVAPSVPAAHRARSARTHSSVRAPRRSKGTSSASNSSRSHPAPIPSRARPPVSVCSVASSLASTSGLRCGRIRMPVPSSRSVVCAPTQVSHTSGSGRSTSSSIGAFPDGLYGYRDS